VFEGSISSALIANKMHSSYLFNSSKELLLNTNASMFLGSISSILSANYKHSLNLP
jgi:hypothetical protein